MTVTPIKEEYLRNFFARQREINKKALLATASLAQANTEMILLSGMSTPSEMLVGDVKKSEDLREQIVQLQQNMTVVQGMVDTVVDAVKVMHEDVKEVQADVDKQA